MTASARARTKLLDLRRGYVIPQTKRKVSPSAGSPPCLRTTVPPPPHQPPSALHHFDGGDHFDLRQPCLLMIGSQPICSHPQDRRPGLTGAPIPFAGGTWPRRKKSSGRSFPSLPMEAGDIPGPKTPGLSIHSFYRKCRDQINIYMIPYTRSRFDFW